MMYLIVSLLLPAASSMKTHGAFDGALTASSQVTPKMNLAVLNHSTDQDLPKMTLAKINGEAHIIAGLEKQFARSEEVHRQSMDRITQELTLPKAIEVLDQSSLGTASSRKRIESLISESSNLRGKGNAEPTNLGGLDGARALLNDMIYEAATKYDAEIAKCVDYYSKQCALMEVARGEIAAASEVAASSRALILDAQYNINKCQVSIPELKLSLKQHNQKCAAELKRLNDRLLVVMNDIKILTAILEMSDCEANLIQTEKLSLLWCKDQCNGRQIKFNNKILQGKLDLLKSPEAHDLLVEAFQDLDDAMTEADNMTFVQVPGSDYLVAVQVRAEPKSELPPTPAPPPVVTDFNNPPVPQTEVPTNPCNDPNQGAPSQATKRSAKCTLKKPPRCYKLQQRFLQIQAGVADERDELMEIIDNLEKSCEETKNTITTSMESDESLLSSSQTKLATAMEKESSAGEKGRQTSAQNDQYDADLKKQMKSCNDNYVGFETELCALKKIRGDLYKKFEQGHTGFFQDCELAPWSPEACTKKCALGTQKLTRAVLTHPDGGAKCLPLGAERDCNPNPCPVDCDLHGWGGWSKCSAKCGGGVSNRVRDIAVAPKFNGKECSEKQESKQCNVAACEKDCVLSEWTEWTSCSKDCDGGTRKRTKRIKEAAEGSGKCQEQWHIDRLEYKQCNMQACTVPDVNATKKCHQSLDVILLLDGTPRSGEEGFKAEQKAAEKLLDAFTVEKVDEELNSKCRVFVYQHGDFTGWVAEYDEGDYDHSKFQQSGGRNDDMSAIVVEGKGCTAELYEHYHYGGWKVTFPEGHYNHDQMVARGARNDAASTLKVKKSDSRPAAMDGSSEMGASSQFSVVYYTGPRTWSGVSKCTSKNSQSVDTEKDCHVKIAQHFTEKLTDVKKTIDGLKYQVGSKLLSLAMMTTQAELALGRPEARTVVIIFIDGEPLSYRNTMLAAKKIRKKARLLWVPVSKLSPLGDIKNWATRRWQENLVTVEEAADWALPATATHIIADICPLNFAAPPVELK
jgi:hypothetical protein